VKGLTILLAVSLLPAQQRVVTFVSRSSQSAEHRRPIARGAWSGRGNGLIARAKWGRFLGVIIRYRTVADHPRRILCSFGAYLEQRGRLHRPVVRPIRSRQYFGYDLAVQSGSENDVYEAAFQGPYPISTRSCPFYAAHQAQFGRPRRVSGLQVVHAGDTIATDVMVAADGKQKIVRLSGNPPRIRPPADTGG